MRTSPRGEGRSSLPVALKDDARLRGSALIGFLSSHLPAGIMVILAVYTLRAVSLAEAPHGVPEAVAIAATVALHLWRRNAVLSILGGTALYVLLVGVVFV